MKAIKIVNKPKEFNKESLSIETIDIPKPVKNEVLIKMKYVSLNPFDYKLVIWPFDNMGKVLGTDGSGVIEAVGDEVKRLKVGDRVHFHGSFKEKYGVFSEYTLSVEESLSILPNDISFEVGASLPCASWTAYKAVVDKARVREGDFVCITGSSGGVGNFCVQLAKHFKAKVIGVCSTSKIDYVKSLGADYVIDYSKEDIHKRILEITENRGVDVYIDNVGQETTDIGLKSLSFGGQLVFVVNPPILPENWQFRQISIHSVFLAWAYNEGIHSISNLRTVGDIMVDLVQKKKIKSEFEIINFEEIPLYIEKISKGTAKGKIVAKIN